MTTDPANVADELTQAYHTPPTTAGEGGVGSSSRLDRYVLGEQLGAGGFGVVYRAFDEQLQRFVAVKTPYAGRFTDRNGASDFLREAQQAAHLDHPYVVPVYDVGHIGDQWYIVYKLIEGCNLREFSKRRPLAAIEVAELIAQVADGLDAAHQKNLYHRDIKASNILVDAAGVPYIADFGLAIREADMGAEPSMIVGSLPYMSPEQVRGEGHRVDGRTDIYSLGVVIYELLTGTRPFVHADHDTLQDEILHREPRPPRQFNRLVPRELERICLKALSKRISDRFATARDLADELRAVAASLASQMSSQAIDSVPGKSTDPLSVRSAVSRSQIFVRVIPRGLRSFSEEDSDFFLELIPGPRGGDGLPDSLRFWKTRIESHQRQSTFAVGLIYGPSGCGKSSLVKAGLLPQLAANVLVAYIEATPHDTENRLRQAIVRSLPTLAADQSLDGMVTSARRGTGLPADTKLLLVIDQFEQWLVSNAQPQNTELVRALRQCDGEHVQVIILVRDDFWAAVSRFMHDLEIHLVEGQNIALVDRFDGKHARKVLTAFGQAYGCLPDSAAEFSTAQQRFLDLAVESLSVNGEIIPVQLSLFAQMLKGKNWLPSLFDKVGGMAGLGVTFLEETFQSSAANPEHRAHRDRARRLLAALLPVADTSLKGQMKSAHELAEACGLPVDSPRFARLVAILDQELRIITSTDATDDDVAGDGGEQSTEPHYQLAHDYLVPSLREWLTQQRRRSWRGRAELRLEERTADWTRTHANRALPSLPEFLSITLAIPLRKRDWAQRRMLKAAAWRHATRSGLAVILLIAIVAGGWLSAAALRESRTRVAQGLVERLLAASPAEVVDVLREVQDQSETLRPHLMSAMVRPGLTTSQITALRLALFPGDEEHLAPLRQLALVAGPIELRLIRDALWPRSAVVSPALWEVALNDKQAVSQRLRAACLLADYDPSSEGWKAVIPRIVEALASPPADELEQWTTMLKPLANLLIPALRAQFKALDEDVHDSEILLPVAKRHAREAALLMLLGDEQHALQELADPSRITSRALFVGTEAAAAWKLDDALALAVMSETSQAERLIALWAIGLREPRPRLNDSGESGAMLLKIYRTHPDPGVHSATGWVLRRCGLEESVRHADLELMRLGMSPDRQWFVNSEGMTLSILPRMAIQPLPKKLSSLMVPAPQVAAAPRTDGQLIAVATCEITRGQFLRFRPANSAESSKPPAHLDHPVTLISLQDAMQFCNWLTQRDGLPDDQQCYVPDDNVAEELKPQLRPAPEVLERTGYRLPVYFECQCFSQTANSKAIWPNAGKLAEEMEPVGQRGILEVASLFAWHNGNSMNATHPVGGRLSNRYGLFDVFGNVSELHHEFSNQDAKENEGQSHQPFDMNPAMHGGNFGQAPLEFLGTKSLGGSGKMPLSGFRVLRALDPLQRSN